MDLKQQALDGKVKIPFFQSGLDDTGIYNDGTLNLSVGRYVAALEHVKRFHLGNEFGSASYNEVFTDGFEDPTHLTFKIEFGEWGASVNDLDTTAMIQRSAYTTNTLFMDYDLYPMGLLDLNFVEATELRFNEQTQYNAHNWLLSRNLDRRAQYIREFIKGIYVLQKDFPYLFTKISGIDKLTDHDAERGQRLKDVTLTLTCLSDGIDLKIRTLFELYRKAAWNDVYQRWELPDIFRYFKMIIYVFDDRCVQMGGGHFSPDQDAFPIMALECGPCEFVIKNQNLQEYTLNYQDIKSHEMTIDIKVKDVTTLFVNQMFLKVKYINDLVHDIDMWKRDDTKLTKSNGQNVNWKYVWLQKNFMFPDEYLAFYRENEDALAVSHGFADEVDALQFPIQPESAEIQMTDIDMNNLEQSLFSQYIPQDTDSTWHQATVSDLAYVVDSWKSLWNAVKSIVTANTVLIRDSRQSDRYYFKNDLMRLNPDTFLYYCHQNFIDIDIRGVRRDMRIYIENMKRELADYKLLIDNSHSNIGAGTPLLLNTELPDENLQFLELNKDKMTQLVDSSLIGGTPADMDLNPLDINDFKPDQDLIDLMLNLAQLEQELTAIEPNLEKIKQELAPLDLNLDLISQSLISLDLNLEQLSQHLTDLVLNLAKPSMDMIDLLKNLELLKQQLAVLLLNLEKPDMKLNGIDKNLDFFKQHLQALLINLDKEIHQMNAIDINDKKPEQELIALRLNLEKILQSLSHILLNLVKPDEELANLLLNLDKPEQELQGIDLNLLKGDEKLIPLILNLQKQYEALTNMIIDVRKQKQDMSGLIVDDSHQTMNMTSPEFNTDRQPIESMIDVDMFIDKNNMSMLDASLNTEHMPKQNMNQIDLNLNINHSPLIDAIIDSSINHSPMNPVIIDTEATHGNMIGIDNNIDVQHLPMISQTLFTDVNHSPMIPDNHYESESNHSPMIPVDSNNEHQHMSMPRIIINSSVNHSPMINDIHNADITNQPIQNGIIDNGQQQHSPLIDAVLNNERLSMNVLDNQLTGRDSQENAPFINPMFDGSKPNGSKMQDISLTLLKPEQTDMEGIKLSTYNGEISDVELVKNLEKSPMKMQELKLNLVKTEDLIDVDLVEGESLDEMKMHKIDENLELTDMKMSEIDDNASALDNMKMQELNRNDVPSGLNAVMNHLIVDDSEFGTGSSFDRLKMNDINIEGSLHIHLTMNQLDKNLNKSELKPQIGEVVGRDAKLGGLETYTNQIGGTMQLIHQEVQPHVHQSMNSIKQEEHSGISQKLLDRLNGLLQLDMDSVQNASVEDMNKLIGIMEQTVKDVKNEMRMTEVKKNTDKKQMLRDSMTQMVGYEKHQFGSDLIKVDENAFLRGLAAQANAQQRMKLLNQASKVNNR